jgi:ribosomal protein S18 acetylase RimI-like enzyme
VRLRPLRGDELDAYRVRQRDDYRQQLVAWAGMTAALAERKAAEDTQELPHGAEVHALEVDGRDVGTVSFAERTYYGEPRVFVYDYDLWVDADERGKGFGRRAMDAVEAEARRRGAPVVELNVWGGNTVARSLYRSLGYAERSVFMSKDL